MAKVPLRGIKTKIPPRPTRTKRTEVKKLVAKISKVKTRLVMAMRRANNRPLANPVQIQGPVKLANQASRKPDKSLERKAGVSKAVSRKILSLRSRMTERAASSQGESARAIAVLRRKRSLMPRRWLKCLPRKWPVRCLRPRKVLRPARNWPEKSRMGRRSWTLSPRTDP